jgi:ATP-binding cassette subfamily C protein
MQIFIVFARQYPLRIALMIGALLFASIVEGFGISIFIPLLALIMRQHESGGDVVAGDVSGLEAKLQAMLQNMVASFGLSNVIAVLLIVFVACIAVKCTLVLLAQRQVGYTSARIFTDLRFKFLDLLFRSRWEYFLRQPIGKLANGIKTESKGAANAFNSSTKVVSFGIEALVYTVIALFVSLKATLMALVLGMVILSFLRRYIRKTRRAGKKTTKVSQLFSAQMVDSLSSIKMLKAMARDGSTRTLLENQTDSLNRLQRKQVANKAALSNLQEPFMMAFLAIILYVTLVHLKMSLAVVVATIYLIRRILKNIHKIQIEYQSMTESESAYWSLRKKMREAQNAREETSGHQLPVLKNGIRIEDVTFGYDDKLILKDLNIHLPMGKFIAIIGPSGAGKTTVADLVIGLLRPRKGEIWIDDLPLAAIDIHRWRRMIGYVPQETLLLHSTIFVNVTLGDESISENDVENALRAAGAWEFVSQLSKGVHTVVGERGGKISGGQRQRIAIARAMINRPKLLILDEATTALDPDTEAAICDTLLKLRGEVTILSISHQSVMLEAAEIAYRLENGAATLLKTNDCLAGDGNEASKDPLVNSGLKFANG